jgi:hypothetical protein
MESRDTRWRRMTTRIGDAQRAEVLNLLSQALEEGYLDLGEYDQRMTAATAAKTADQLVDQVADLPHQLQWSPQRSAVAHPGPATRNAHATSAETIELEPAGHRKRLQVLALAAVLSLIAAGYVGFAAGTAWESRGGASDTAGETTRSDPLDGGSATTRSPSPKPPATPDSALGSPPAPTISVPLMPELVGLSETEARQALPAGADVEIVVEEVGRDDPGGVVLDQQPGEGEPVGDQVILTVSASPVVVRLVDLDPAVRGGFRNEPVELEGQSSHSDSLIRDINNCTTSGATEYNLGRRYVELQTLAGLDDRGERADAEVVLEIFGNQRKLYETTLVMGSPREIELDVTEVLRLEFRWTFTNSFLCTFVRSVTHLVLFEPELVAEPGHDPYED